MANNVSIKNVGAALEAARALARAILLIWSFVACLATSPHAAAQSGLVDPPRSLYTTATGVNLIDLAYVLKVNDLTSGPLSLERNYSSAYFRSNNYFGERWTNNFDIWIEWGVLHDQSYTNVVMGRSIYKFYGSPGSALAQNDEIGTSVTLVAGAPVFTDRDGTRYQFEASGYPPRKVTSITRPNGEVLAFLYNAGRLQSVSTNLGYAIVFDYAGNYAAHACAFNLSDTHVDGSTTCASANIKASYNYSGTNLISVTDVKSRVWSYSYTAGGYLACASDPDSSFCPMTNTYGPKNGGNVYGVVQQTFADGAVWQYDCSCGLAAASDPDDFYPIEWTTVTQPNSVSTSTWFRGGSPYKQWDGLGHLYEWDFFGRYPASMTKPDGDKTIWNYNFDRLVPAGRTLKAKPGSGIPDINVDTATFPTVCSNQLTCNKPATISDPRGNVTAYTYDPTHGGVLSEMKPAPSSGAARPLRLVTYVQKYAYVRDSGNTLVASSTPVWLIDTETQCQTTVSSSVATCDGAAPITVVTYEYGANGAANNLLLRGKVITSGGVSLRTCYGYDARGRTIWETSPRGTSAAVCS
jgi:YD repeat-containing protein